MVKLKRIVVHAGPKLVFDMTLQPDGSWKTVKGPGSRPEPKRRPRTGRAASLLRKHKKWLTQSF